MKKIFLYVFVAVAIVSCASEKNIPSRVNVKNISELNNATNNALLYSLPVTVIRVDVEVEKVISKVGPFYRYSKKLLNVSDVVTEDKEEWRIKSVNIVTYGVPDEDKEFVITYEGDNIAPFINLTPSGVLTGLNANTLPGGQDITLTHFETKEIPTLDNVNFNNVPMLEKQLTQTSTAAMAEETANLIYKIRKRRFKILASDFEQLPPDGKSYEIVVRELNELEKSHLELFVGKREVFTLTHSFNITPDKLSANNDVLFRFSSVNGIVDKMDVSGAPVYYELTVEDREELPSEQQASDHKEEIRNGLYYCQPGKANIKIIDKNKLIKEQEVLLGQFGQIISMPFGILEQNNVSINLDPATGALKSIEKNN